MFILIVTLGNSCRPDAEPLVIDLVFEKLAGTWTPPTEGGVVIDGVDYTANFKGFTLSFAKGTYSTTNGADLFKATGTWEFTDPNGEGILTDDGKLITLREVSVNNLVFSFQYEAKRGEANGVNSVSGNYSLNLGK